MAATTSGQRPMPLLRRPLPPKNIAKPPSTSSLPSLGFHEDATAISRSKSPAISTRARSKAKVDDGRIYHGDIVVPDKSVVKPYRPRGPPALPPRQPRKVREGPPPMLDSYSRPPPAFTLKNFMQRVPSRCGPEEHNEVMISDQNYEKLKSWFTTNHPKQSHVHSLELDTIIDVPDVTPRIPTRQLLIEMKLPMAEMDVTDTPDYYGYPNHLTPKLLPLTPAVSKQTNYSRHRPLLPPIEHKTQGVHPGEDFALTDMPCPNTTMVIEQRDISSKGTEKTHETSLDMEGVQEVKTIGETTVDETTNEEKIINQEFPTDENEGVPNSAKQKINFKTDIEESFEMKDEVDTRKKHEDMWMNERGLTFDQLPHVITYQDLDVVLPSSAPIFYQGEAIPRTSSPFGAAYEDETQVTPLEAVILNAIMTESTTLNIKAHFLSELPTLHQLADHLTHVNASFNDFWVFPPELFDLHLLVSLRLRNNPIKEIPHEICNLKQLRVLDMSFNLITALPKCLFELKNLEVLELSYNRISFIPPEIGNLRSLRELGLDGNQIRALPVNALHLPLKYLRISNNFIHPLLWRETTSNQPQRLFDLCALVVHKTEQDSLKMATLPDSIKAFLKSSVKCDCCGGVCLGQGLRVLKSPEEIFGIKNLPFLFTVCSQRCRKTFIKNKDALNIWLIRNNITIKKAS